MRLLESASKLRLALLLGSATGLATGCVVTLGSGTSSSECGGTFSNSEPQPDGTCACDAGYDWCNPTDPDDFECCALDSCESGSNNHVVGDNCVCDAGFTWCNPDDINDLDCCEIPGGETGSSGEATSGDGDGDGDTSTSGDGDGDNLPPETCTMAEEGASWCNTDPGDALENSRWWFCIEGVWTEFPTFMDESCIDEGADFAYGCEYRPNDPTPGNYPVCGTGSGAMCDNADANTCADATTLSFCLHSRLGTEDCQLFCENGSLNGLGEDFEFGECEVVNGDADCSCYNSP